MELSRMRCFVLVGMAILGGCASGITRAGELASPPGSAGPRTFVLGAEPPNYAQYQAEAGAAVANALASRGYVLADQARYRVDFAFITAPPGVGVGEGEKTRPRLAARLFCKPRRHTLSVAMTDRATGDMLLRRTASAVRCGKPRQLLDTLAAAVFEPA